MIQTKLNVDCIFCNPDSAAGDTSASNYSTLFILSGYVKILYFN
jgi:hypothetical protein